MPNAEQLEAQQAQLLRRIAEQDASALGELYDQTSTVFYSFALRMLSDTHDAEEVVQDTFVQIWNKAQSFDPTAGIAFHWAMSIIRNRCIDQLRSRQRRSRVVVEMEEGREPEQPVEPANDSTHLSGDELGVVRTALGSLPEDQRKAIEMAFFGGLTHQEIAQTLNEPLGTVKARIRRGMLKLREGLEAYL